MIKLSRGRSVSLCVNRSVGRSDGASVCPVHCGKQRIGFGIIGRAGPGMKQVLGFGDRSTGSSVTAEISRNA